MSRIIPVPTTRVGDFFIRQRLSDQVQADQLALFKLQNQVSTGHRLQLPSDDAPAALRAINLQRLLDRKSQIRTNVQSSNFYLGAANDSLNQVSQQLNEIRSAALGASGTVASESERVSAMQAVDRTLQSLVTTANSKVQGRYLFSGSRSQTQPYDFTGQSVEYRGNQGVLRSYVDLENLFETNLSGQDVFGGVSSAVEGTVDLNPQLTANTLVSTLNGGSGISRNAAITVSVDTGSITESSVVDLSGAVTVGDVARLIEANSPSGTNITVQITGNGLTLQTNTGTIRVSEVAQGRTAKELGIFTSEGAPPSATLVGGDVNPAVLKTTRLADLLGTKAEGRLVSSAANNNLVIRAARNGVAFNGVTVQFVGGGAAGSEVANYNSGTKTLTVQIQDGFSTANQVAAAITAEGTFTAAADYHDATSAVQSGTNTVGVATFATITNGGTGEVLDTTSGLMLTNGGTTQALDISGAETVEELLNLINGSGLGFQAEINAAGDGINVRSRLSGPDFTIGENGGTTATQLGIRTYTGATELSAMNRGTGVPTTSTLETLDTAKLDNLSITARDGTVLSVSLAGSVTLQDVATKINTALGNNTGTTAVLARVTAGANGLELVDSSTVTTGRLTVNTVPGSQAAQYLGFVQAGQSQSALPTSDVSHNDVLTGGKVLGNDLIITARDGKILSVDLASTTTVQDVINRINGAVGNNSGTTVVTARLAKTGNGIELVDSSVGSGSLSVQVVEGSQAAEYLGFVPSGQTQVSTSVNDGSGNFVIKSEDRNTLETDSVFNTLTRLRTALEQDDVEGIHEAIDRLDVDLDRVNFARSEIGARLQSLDVIGTRLQDEDVQLKSALSGDLDVDLVEAISNLTARQYAFEASLRTAASLLQVSLLNFI